MAVVWQKQINGDLYQVRSAGNSLRLYTNGVFHTQYNKHQPLTGHVWDLLMVPAFFYPPDTVKRVLILGLGGGTVVHALRRFVRPVSMTGIELDSTHLSIARKFFALRGSDVRVHNADAVSWLKQYKGRPFDLIIEDLFRDEDGQPVSAVRPGRTWFELMLRHLNKDGMIVKNFADNNELKTCSALTNQAVNRRFRSIYRLITPLDDNCVGVFSKHELCSRQLRERLSAVPGLNPALKTSRLRYSIRRL